MHKKIIWGLAGLLTLTVVFVAQAALQESYFMPLIFRQMPTATMTPTVTLTPTPTKTPDTPCLSGSTEKEVCITDIDYAPDTGGPLNEFITLKNLGSLTSLEDWRISSDTGNKFDITYDFELVANGTVKVWTKVGVDDSDEIFMDRTEEFWKDNEDCAYIHDEDSDPVDAICYNKDEELFYVPATIDVP